MPEWLWYSPGDAGKRVVEFDADFVDESLRKGMETLVEVVLSGYATDDAGLPDDSVVDSIFKLEEAIGAVASEAGGAYVADVAEGGTYRMLIYAPSDDVAARVRSAAGDSFKPAVDAKGDASWSAYDAVALRGEELEALRDQEQLDEIDQAGIDVSGGLEITFDFEFDGADKARKGHEALRAAGYPLDELTDDIDPYEDFPTVEVTLECAADADAIGEQRRKIAAILTPQGGVYVGWGIDPDEPEE